MSLATAGIYCTTRLPLRVRYGRQFHSPGPAAANPLSSKVSTSQLTMHVRHVVERIVVAREHRQKDGGRWLGTITTMVKCQTATDERASQPWSRRSGVPVTSVADGEPALCVWTSSTRNQTGDGALNRLQPVHQSFRHSQRTESCSSPDDRRRTPGSMSYSHLQTMTGQPAVSGASGSRHFDRPQWREALPTVMVLWNQATGLSLMVSEIFNGECDAMVDITLNEL